MITPTVLRVLMPYWNAKPESTNHVRHRRATIFDFTIAAGYCSENSTNGALQAALPQRQRNRQHRPALPHVDMADCSEAIHEAPGRPLSKLALELLMVKRSCGRVKSEARLIGSSPERTSSENAESLRLMKVG